MLKKYDIGKFGMKEEKDGPWIPAKIGREMYDALKAVIKSAGLDEDGAAQPVSGGPLDMAIRAVAKAEGGSND